MIRVSAGTAYVLGFRKLSIDVLPTTAYLMAGDRCINNCGFCPRARGSRSRSGLLSRITWHEADPGDVVIGLKQAYEAGILKRVCLQVVDGGDTFSQIADVIAGIKDSSGIPICISARFKTGRELRFAAALGVDRITIALDAATPRIFEKAKSGSWQRTLDVLYEAVDLLPGKVSTHLIAGLGETEEELVRTIQHMKHTGIGIGLFAFTPVPGTKFSNVQPPNLDSYRRIQAAHYLIEKGFTNNKRCKFRSGQLVNLGLTEEELRKHLSGGEAFQTSGCPDCNRPYYNERPGGVFYNYPRALKPEEAEAAVGIILTSATGGA